MERAYDPVPVIRTVLEFCAPEYVRNLHILRDAGERTANLDDVEAALESDIDLDRRLAVKERVIEFIARGDIATAKAIELAIPLLGNGRGGAGRLALAVIESDAALVSRIEPSCINELRTKCR